MIIYSVAATRGIKFAEDPNRLNVAVTRAKKKLIVIANRAKVEDGEGLLGKYVEYVGERGGVFYYDRSTGRILDGS